MAATTRTPGTHWPLTDALAAAQPTLVDGPTLLVPLRLAAKAPGQGVLVAGTDPSRVVDEPLIGLLTQIGQHISVMLASAGMQREADQHVRILALLDDALQKFFAIGLITHAALADLSADRLTDNIAPALIQIIDAATSGRENLRDAIFALSRGEAGPTGLAGRLRTLARRFEQRTGIDAEVLVIGQARGLPTEASETLEQTAAEALAGIERRSKAAAVVLSLRVTARSVTLSVQDDGVSIATNCRLRGLAQRVREMGGTFVAKPVREGGFLVRTRLPLVRA